MSLWDPDPGAPRGTQVASVSPLVTGTGQEGWREATPGKPALGLKTGRESSDSWHLQTLTRNKLDAGQRAKLGTAQTHGDTSWRGRGSTEAGGRAQGGPQAVGDGNGDKLDPGRKNWTERAGGRAHGRLL